MKKEIPKIGTRVVYEKPNTSSRNGWRGTMVRAKGSTSKIAVRWDNLDELTYYLPDAFHAIAGFADAHHGYIYACEHDTERGELFIVAGEDGGQPIRVFGTEGARECAKNEAKKSKSGQAYVIFSAAEKFQRTTPPIEHTILEK